ncbi:peptidase [Cryptococcus wingfieldii CBS 7118]|uniref:Peptidase n=1 Tax=Cryptococcus wingfieldii CBS 7118 TaxID=1295528 RepID=A0A1E3K6L3_9TREE|nr:peptidase [Cryptococcus wingfieldii CBS 7118]ODO08780.1 peptidase [Cryptococcus wingfieldii CBS 7118]
MVAFRAPAALLSFALFAWSLVGAATLEELQADAGSRSHRTVVPNRYIVEFDSSAHYSSAGLKRAATPHEYIYSQLDARSTSYTVHAEYSCQLFFGASLSLTSEADLQVLLNITGVIDFRSVHSLSLPADAIHAENIGWTAQTTFSSSELISEGDESTSTSSSSNASTPTASVNSTAATSAPFSNLPQIGADKVHATGNKGKGIKIGVVDGGVDYTREPLGGCFGSGCKIAGGYDFVGDNYNGSNTPVEDSDPYDNCYSHGTVVSGIIGANENEYGVGVAPEAEIYVYRTFSCDGSTSDDIVMSGLQRAYDENMDIINLSIGEASGWTESMLSVFVSRLVNNGTIVTSSAGNQGQIGAFYSYSPAAGEGVINVGSSDNSIYPAHYATVSTGYGPIPYYNYKAYTDGTLQLYTIDSDEYGCTLPDDVPDLSPYLVIVRRGGCSLSAKAQAIYNAGGTALFVVNDGTSLPIYQNFPLINFAIISLEDGNYLLDQINASTNATVSFSFNPVALPNVWTNNTASYFSEIGPTNDLYLAPDVLAPGSNIVCVTPTALYNWTIGDGTSWSSAFAAGAAALYLADKGTNNITPADVKGAFEISADQLSYSMTDSSLASVAWQGAGRLRVDAAIDATAVITPSEILLNDTANFQRQHVLTVKNPSSSWVTFRFDHEAAGTMLAFQSGLNQSADEPVPQVNTSASVKIFPSTLTLWPGQSLVTTLTFAAPSGLDAAQFPVYSGFIKVTGGATTVRVPYLGVAANMKDMPVLDPTSYYLGINTPVIMNPSFSVQDGTKAYSFNSTDYPSVLYRLAGGTPYISIDLIDSNSTLSFTPDYTTKKRSGQFEHPAEPRRLQSSGGAYPLTKTSSLLSLWCKLTNFQGSGCSSTDNTFGSVDILGNLYSDEWVPRSTDNVDSEGGDYSTFELSSAAFANGTAIPGGTYRFLLRALHIFGDSTEESDYESWVSQPFIVPQ